MRYGTLFAGSALVFTVVNCAIVRLAPEQYSFSGGRPSVLRVALYSTSSLAFNAGAGLEATGDAAVVVRLLAGVVGVVFLATLFVTVVFSYRRDREDLAIKRTVEDLKQRAAAHEARLKESLDVTIDEALRRLDTLGANLAGLLLRITAEMPDDFWKRTGGE